MSRGTKFSKRGGGGSAQDEIGRTIHERVETLLENRWKYLNPFDMFKDVKEEIYRWALSAEEWEAWRLLHGNKHFNAAMNYTDRLYIRNHAAQFNLSLQVPHARFVKVSIEWENLPEGTQELIHNWVIRSEAYRWEYVAIKDRVQRLVRLCSTPGQIERVWPELMGFMPGEVIDRRFAKKAQSPYPEGAYDEYEYEEGKPVRRELKEEFRPEVLDGFNDALAEALILPVQNWNAVTTFPVVEVTR